MTYTQVREYILYVQEYWGLDSNQVEPFCWMMYTQVREYILYKSTGALTATKLSLASG
jgi:hypothetical protein